MLKKILGVLLLALAVPLVVAAQDLQAISQPDRIHIFQNNIAYVQDTLSLPGGAEVALALPTTAIIDTLVLREDGERVSSYTIQRDNQITISWQSDSTEMIREVTAEYLIEGISWYPKYDMVINDETSSAAFDYFAEIQNNAFPLDSVEAFLVAGSVGTSQILDDRSAVAFNQLYAEADFGSANTGNASIDSVTIQHVYDIGQLSVQANETLVTQIVSEELPVRRVLLWNANADNEVTVIYKVQNDTDQPFSPGIVRSYRDGLILGSDPIERTPVGSEGSVTVGTLPDVRVKREVTQEPTNPSDYYDTLHTVTFEIENFSADTITIEVIDFYPVNSTALEFQDEPVTEPGNVLRWMFTLEPDETLETVYTFLTP
jgi:hypothetical protein